MTTLRGRLQRILRQVDEPSPSELEALVRTLDVRREDIDDLPTPGLFPYGREVIFANEHVEVLVMNWAKRQECAPHDHGASFGWVSVLSGTPEHTLYSLNQRDVPVSFATRREATGGLFFAPRGLIHSMSNLTDDEMVTLHFYAPPITGMRVYDLDKCAYCVVSDDCGAWWPPEQRQILDVIRVGLRRQEATAV